MRASGKDRVPVRVRAEIDQSAPLHFARLLPRHRAQGRGKFFRCGRGDSQYFFYFNNGIAKIRKREFFDGGQNFPKCRDPVASRREPQAHRVAADMDRRLRQFRAREGVIEPVEPEMLAPVQVAGACENGGRQTELAQHGKRQVVVRCETIVKGERHGVRRERFAARNRAGHVQCGSDVIARCKVAADFPEDAQRKLLLRIKSLGRLRWLLNTMKRQHTSLPVARVAREPTKPCSDEGE